MPAINPKLTDEQKGAMIELLRGHKDLMKAAPVLTKQSPLIIHTTTTYPIHQPPQAGQLEDGTDE